MVVPLPTPTCSTICCTGARGGCRRGERPVDQERLACSEWLRLPGWFCSMLYCRMRSGEPTAWCMPPETTEEERKAGGEPGQRPAAMPGPEAPRGRTGTSPTWVRTGRMCTGWEMEAKEALPALAERGVSQSVLWWWRSSGRSKEPPSLSEVVVSLEPKRWMSSTDPVSRGEAGRAWCPPGTKRFSRMAAVMPAAALLIRWALHKEGSGTTQNPTLSTQYNLATARASRSEIMRRPAAATKQNTQPPLPAPRATHALASWERRRRSWTAWGEAESDDLRGLEDPEALRLLPLVADLSGAAPMASYSLRRSQSLLLECVTLPYTICTNKKWAP